MNTEPQPFIIKGIDVFMDFDVAHLYETTAEAVRHNVLTHPNHFPTGQVLIWV